MIQIGMQPRPAAFPETLPADPAEIIGRRYGQGPEPAGTSSVGAEDQILFVSPPPLPFPRVFPGL